MMASDETLEKIRLLLAAPALGTGGATSAKQDTGNTSLASIDGKLPATASSEATLAKLLSGLDFAAVTPSDSTVLTGVRALYVGTGGDVIVDGASTTNVTFKAVPSGTVLPITVTKVCAATGASNIVALK